MMATFLESLGRLIQFLTPFVPSLISFALGWGLFEVQERRRRSMQRRATADALIAELKSAEAILSAVVTRFAFGTDDPSEGIKELRWYATEGHNVSVQIDEPSPEMLELLPKSDAELTAIFRSLNPTRHPGFALSLPTVDAILANPALGLSREQFLKLTAAKWQSQLLAVIAADMREWVRLTFTVEDEDNHAIAVENLDNARKWFGKRAKYMLDAIREAVMAFAK